MFIRIPKRANATSESEYSATMVVEVADKSKNDMRKMAKEQERKQKRLRSCLVPPVGVEPKGLIYAVFCKKIKGRT